MTVEGRAGCQAAAASEPARAGWCASPAAGCADARGRRPPWEGRRSHDQLVLGGFALARVRRHPLERLPPHVHQRLQACVVEKGCLLEQVDGERRAYPAGGIVLRPSGSAHHDLGTPEGALLIQIDVEPAFEARLVGLLPARHPSYVGLDLVGDLARRFDEEWRRQDAASPLALEGLLLAAWASVARLPQAAPDRAPPHVRRAAELIEAAYAGPLSLRDVARAAGVTPVRLAQDFRRFRGSTVNRSVVERRVREAARLLAQSSAGIGDVAVACGFCDQSHLTRVFKRHRSLTPAEYRRLHRRIG